MKFDAHIAIIAGAGGPPEAIVPADGLVSGKKFDSIVVTKEGKLLNLRKWSFVSDAPQIDVFADKNYANFDFPALAVLAAGDGFYFTEVETDNAEILGYPHKNLP